MILCEGTIQSNYVRQWAKNNPNLFYRCLFNIFLTFAAAIRKGGREQAQAQARHSGGRLSIKTYKTKS